MRQAFESNILQEKNIFVLAWVTGGFSCRTVIVLQLADAAGPCVILATKHRTLTQIDGQSSPRPWKPPGELKTMFLADDAGNGTMPAFGVEKLNRDAAMFLHMDGTIDIAQFKIVKTLLPETAGNYAGPEN
jgi:hypothetical protein